MTQTWKTVDSGNDFATADFDDGEGVFLHNNQGNSIVSGDLVMLQLTTWTAAATSRTFTVTGQNGLTFAQRAVFVSGDGKTRTELWTAEATGSISSGNTSGTRIAAASSSITEDALIWVADFGNGIADTTAYLAVMVENDFTKSYLETGSLGIVSSGGDSVVYFVTSIPSIQHPTAGQFTPSTDFSTTGNQSTGNNFSDGGNGYPGTRIAAWDDQDGAEYIRNQHNGNTESWHIFGFPGESAEPDGYWG